MEQTVMRERVVAARVARLATVTAEGRPHVVPCCFTLAADTIYSAVDGKPKTTLALRRLANVEANPAASLLVDQYDDDDWSALWWVRLDGDARVVADLPERESALTLLAAKYPEYTRTPPPGDVIAIEVTAWRAWPQPPRLLLRLSTAESGPPERGDYLGAGEAATRASATIETIAWRTCSPVVHSSGKPRRTAARPAGLTAIISKP